MFKLDRSSLNKMLNLDRTSLDSFRNNPTLLDEKVSLGGTLVIFAKAESHLGILWGDGLAFADIVKQVCGKYTSNVKRPNAQTGQDR